MRVIDLRAYRSRLVLTLYVLAILAVSTRGPAAATQQAQSTAAPELQVEYLGSDKGYAVAGQSVTILCVIRNVGGAPLPENSARVRCYPLTGLDFMEGQLWPTLPALAPRQAVAYRWRLAVTDQATPLVISVLISKSDVATPGPQATGAGVPSAAAATANISIEERAVTASIPRFTATPHLLGAATASSAPQASAARGIVRVGNDRVMLHVVGAQDRVPICVLAGKEGGDWKNVATIQPFVRVRSGEDGQIPWWESFRWLDTGARVSKDSAQLSLDGSVGANWAAQISVESTPNTGLLNCKLRLTARRTLRVYGVELPRLLAASPGGAPAVRLDGSAALLNADAPQTDDRLAAAHSGALTFGIAWPETPPVTGWRSTKAAPADGEHLPILGGEWSGNDRGELVPAGASIVLPFRMFAFGPSDTVHDADRFRMP